MLPDEQIDGPWLFGRLVLALGVVAAVVVAAFAGYAVGADATGARVAQLQAERDTLRGQLALAETEMDMQSSEYRADKEAFALMVGEWNFYRGVYSLCLFGLELTAEECNEIVAIIHDKYDGFYKESPGYVSPIPTQ